MEPQPRTGESISWSGPCANAKATGNGTLQWFVNGKPNGRYEGAYVDGMRHGKGIYTDGKGIYTGDLAKDMYSGKGLFTFAPGSAWRSVEGDFRDGKVNGVAAMIWANGDLSG